MGTPGPKPKPAARKRLEGNRGKRKLNDREPSPPAGSPEMPPHLDAASQEAWRWLCGILKGMGLLFTSDVAVMTLYCDTWAEYVAARKAVQKYGSVIPSKSTGQPYMSPYVTLESMLKKQLMSCLSELGLSPTSRARLHVERTKESDPLAEFGIVG